MFLYYMQGCILDCAEEMDIVLKKGSWYSYGDQRYDYKILAFYQLTMRLTSSPFIWLLNFSFLKYCGFKSLPSPVYIQL